MQTYTVNTRMSKCEVPIGMLALECDLCHSLVALFDPNKVRIPLHATMFESLTMVRGGPPPFQLAAKRLGDDNWKLCQCRACNNFVFLDRKTRRCKTSLLTPFGVWEIGSRVVPHKITQAELNQQKIDDEFKEEEPIVEEEKFIPKESHCRYCNKYYNSAFWLEKHEAKCKGKP